MSDKRYEANIIRTTAVEPANNIETTSAPGVWSLDEVMELQKKNKWPTAGNVTTDVDDVFSTFLYTGAGGTTATINNGIDLLNEGGLVWIKARNATENHGLFDTVRGVTKYISSNNSNAEATNASTLTNFYNNGFKVDGNGIVGSSTDPYVSWSFRKAPKFFDIVSYTGNNGTQTINHNLGSVPGMIIVKRLNDAGNWGVKHRSIAATNAVFLNSSDQSYANSTYWGDTEPTSTQFTVGLTSSVDSAPYVAYLFAHNNNDGGFGPNQDQDIIKCGSYTGDGGAGTTEVNLGFEPQWIIVKASSAADSWYMIDNMRGWATHNNQANDAYLYADATNTEATGGVLDITSTGFKTTLYSNANVNGRTYIYMAIRRGPLAVPESATDVFSVHTGNTDSTSTFYTSGFPVDFGWEKTRGDTWDHFSFSRLQGAGKTLRLNDTTAEATFGAGPVLDSNTKFTGTGGIGDQTANGGHVFYVWKRAPSYFDVVAYTGNSTQGRTISHNLGAVPEMMWIKSRSNADGWKVYHKDTGATKYLTLNDTSSATTDTWINNTAPTDSVFTLGGSGSGVNYNGLNYIAYLFATVAGVSKVGSYTADGNAQNIDCGFSSGARFVLIKRTDTTGNWFVLDTARGIVAGNDPLLELNSTSAEDSGYDNIDPHSSGFTITAYGGTSPYLNISGATYIFYAIA